MKVFWAKGNWLVNLGNGHRFSIQWKKVGGSVSRNLVCIFLLLIGNPGWAEEGRVHPSTLAVSGEGKISLAPDTALVNVAVETAGESFEAVLEENRTHIQEVLNALQVAGIPKERIQTRSFDVSPQYATKLRRPGELEDTQPPRIIGYIARNALQVEVRDLEQVGKVIDRALGSGANRFSGIEWILRDQYSVYLQALEMAAKRAQHKAQTLAMALHTSLVRLISVQEGGIQVSPPIRSFAKAGLAMTESADRIMPVAPGEIHIQAQVSLVYKIQSDEKTESSVK